MRHNVECFEINWKIMSYLSDSKLKAFIFTNLRAIKLQKWLKYLNENVCSLKKKYVLDCNEISIDNKGINKLSLLIIIQIIWEHYLISLLNWVKLLAFLI